MEGFCLGVVAAMPEEIAPLLRRVRDYRKEKADGSNLYRFEVRGIPVVLIESGMGPKHAVAATQRLIALAAPTVILNFGFAGEVVPGIGVGELVLAERVLLLEQGRLTEAPQPDRKLSSLLLDCCASGGVAIREGTFITASAIMNKAEVAKSWGRGLKHPVLEMETAAVLAAAQRAGIPVVAVRGVSDGADEELGFSLDEFCDTDLKISLPRILGCILRKPWIIPQLVKLSRNSTQAGKNMALCVELALEVIGKEKREALKR